MTFTRNTMYGASADRAGRSIEDGRNPNLDPRGVVAEIVTSRVAVVDRAAELVNYAAELTAGAVAVHPVIEQLVRDSYPAPQIPIERGAEPTNPQYIDAMYQAHVAAGEQGTETALTGPIVTDNFEQPTYPIPAEVLAATNTSAVVDPGRAEYITSQEKLDRDRRIADLTEAANRAALAGSVSARFPIPTDVNNRFRDMN